MTSIVAGFRIGRASQDYMRLRDICEKVERGAAA
jgi:hypothetical protein